MFEIDDPARRAHLLNKLGGVENCVTITVAGEAIAGVAEDDVERSTDEGPASSVQFLHLLILGLGQDLQHTLVLVILLVRYMQEVMQ